MSSAQIVSASAIHNRTNATMFAGTPGIVSSPAPAHTMFSGGQAAAAGGSPVLIKQELAQFTANPQMVTVYAYTHTYMHTYTHTHTRTHTHGHTVINHHTDLATRSASSLHVTSVRTYCSRFIHCIITSTTTSHESCYHSSCGW